MTLNKQIMAGSYPGIVKTKLDGVNQLDYLSGKSEKSARDTFFYYTGPQSVGGAVQELEVLLHDGRRRPGRRRLTGAVDAITGPRSQNIKRDPFETARRRRIDKTAPGHTAARWPAPSTAYLYNWNILPIGQLLWLKELESYKEFPPLQDRGELQPRLGSAADQEREGPVRLTGRLG